MKLNKTIILCSTLIMTAGVLPTKALASTGTDSSTTFSSQVNTVNSKQTIITDLNSLDPYIRVQDNQFKLVLPENVVVSSEIKQEAQEQLDKQNSIVLQNHATIDPETKTATITVNNETGSNTSKFNILAKSKYHQGINKVSVHWNYARVWIKRSTLKVAINSGVNIANIWIPSKVVKTALAGLGIGSLAIPGGIVFDVNYFGSIVSNASSVRWQ